jgi:hypothetical protein
VVKRGQSMRGLASGETVIEVGQCVGRVPPGATPSNARPPAPLGAFSSIRTRMR